LKYAWIEFHSRQWPVSLTCQVLGVSPSGYHARKARDVDTERPRRRISNDALLVHIKAVHAESKGEYGWPRVWKKLLAQGIRVSKDRVQRLMKLHGIRAKTKRRFKATTDSNHNLPVAPNLLQRDFSPARPDQAWSTDITYLWTDELGSPVPFRPRGPRRTVRASFPAYGSSTALSAALTPALPQLHRAFANLRVVGLPDRSGEGR
jgi:transposase InsO family protein